MSYFYKKKLIDLNLCCILVIFRIQALSHRFVLQLLFYSRFIKPNHKNIEIAYPGYGLRLFRF